ncbi:MAG TPA: HDOD domain-containing protein [Polyangiales bacterium]|nr:HDOD domain-containing protein [Polyangiales bacterium]
MTKASAEYGHGAHSIDTAAYELAKPEELQHTLLTIFRAPSYRPPVLPSVAFELTELTRKSSISYDDVVSVLQKDPMIVAGVLKVAQSPLYGGRPVQSLKEAIQRLGINTLRDIVWQVVSGLRLFRAKGYTAIMERLQLHSMFTAYMARLIATRARVAAEHAFLCGLLHDVGISGTFIALAESEKQLPALGTLLAAVDGMHDQAGVRMAKLWGLSPEIAKIIEQHHTLDADLDGAPALIAVICVAEYFADELGFGVLDEPETSFDRYLPGRYERALGRLRLQAKTEELRREAAELAVALRG